MLQLISFIIIFLLYHNVWIEGESKIDEKRNDKVYLLLTFFLTKDVLLSYFVSIPKNSIIITSIHDVVLVSFDDLIGWKIVLSNNVITMNFSEI